MNRPDLEPDPTDEPAQQNHEPARLARPDPTVTLFGGLFLRKYKR